MHGLKSALTLGGQIFFGSPNDSKGHPLVNEPPLTTGWKDCYSGARTDSEIPQFNDSEVQVSEASVRVEAVDM